MTLAPNLLDNGGKFSTSREPARSIALLTIAPAVNSGLVSRSGGRAARNCVSTISPGTVTGHASAGGAFPADVDFMNSEISGFLDLVTRKGKGLE
jgi:hypothetical protein